MLQKIDRPLLSTWRLFVYVFLGWGASDNAIFLRDAGRAPIWRHVVQRMARRRTAWVLCGLFFWIIGIVYAHNALFFFVPPLIIFTLALALTLGPVIVEERTKLSWEPLLTTPYDMKTILLGKASGALWHIRTLTYAMVISLMCVSAGVGTIGLILVPIGKTGASSWLEICLCAGLFIIPVLCSLLFIVDRMQQYALIAVAALASGTAASSIRAALSNAIVVVLLIWLIEIVATETFLTLARGEVWQLNFTSILSVATLGPIVSYMSQLDFSHAAALIVGTLLLREVLIRGLWQWAQRSARWIPTA